MTDLEYKSKVAPLPVFDIRKAFKTFAIVTKDQTINQINTLLDERIQDIEITNEEEECLKQIKNIFKKICKKSMFSSNISDMCSVSRDDIKEHYRMLLEKNNILHYRVDLQIANITEPNLKIFVDKVNKFYKLTYPNSYATNEGYGKEIFDGIMRDNCCFTHDKNTFPKLAIYPYLSQNMMGPIKIEKYKQKILKYYRDFKFPVTFDGKTINIHVPDTFSKFIDDHAKSNNFIFLSKYYRKGIISAHKTASERNLKLLMKNNFYIPKTDCILPSTVVGTKQNIDNYLTDISYHTQSISKDVSAEFEKIETSNIFLTLDGKTILPEYLEQFEFDDIKHHNFKIIAILNQEKIIQTNSNKFLEKIAEDLAHMYYVPEKGYKLPEIINNNYFKNNMNNFREILNKGKYNIAINKYISRYPSHSLTDIIKNMPMNYKLNYFLPQKSSQSYKNFNTSGKSHQFLPQIEITDVRADNIRLLYDEYKHPRLESTSLRIPIESVTSSTRSI